MKKIGIVVAVEFPTVLKITDAIDKIEKKSCYKILKIVHNDIEFIFLESGPGEIQAGAATQFLIDNYKPDCIVNLGFAGGLTSKLKVGDLCLVENVVHTDYDVSQINRDIQPGQYPGLTDEKIRLDKKLIDEMKKTSLLTMVSCASQDKIIIGDQMRQVLAEQWQCDICDMELAGICIIALKNKVPLASLKVVSDTVGDRTDSIDFSNEIFEEKFRALLALLWTCEN